MVYEAVDKVRRLARNARATLKAARCILLRKSANLPARRRGALEPHRLSAQADVLYERLPQDPQQEDDRAWATTLTQAACDPAP